MNLEEELNNLRAQLDVKLPMCNTHGDKMAIAFCGKCGKCICEECLSITPREARCPSCKLATHVMPSHMSWLTGFLAHLWKRPWFIMFATGTVAFTGLILALPKILRPAAPEIPKAMMQARVFDPNLQKVFRLRSIGDLYKKRDNTEKANEYYNDSIKACKNYIKNTKDSYLKLQTILGIGNIQAKSGNYNEAIKTYRKLILIKGKKPTTGVAHFYLAQIYENHLNDKAKAIKHYQSALLYAQKEGDALDKFVNFYEQEGGQGSKKAYAIAEMTGTLTSASAVHTKIVESLQKLTGKEVETLIGGFSTPTTKPEKKKKPTKKDPLIIIKGR